MRVLFHRCRYDIPGIAPFPMLADGRMLLLPTFTNASEDPLYADLRLSPGVTYYDIMRGIVKNHPDLDPGLTAKIRWLAGETHCDLNPDLEFDTFPRPEGWKPNIRIDDQVDNLEDGDLIMLYAPFVPMIKVDEEYQFDVNVPAKKIAVAGYLEVGSSISTYHRGPGLPGWLSYHGSNGFWDADYGSEYAGGSMNFFIASNNLGDTLIPGAGPFRFHEDLMLHQLIRQFDEFQGCSLLRSFIVHASAKLKKHLYSLIEKHRYSPIE